MRIWSFALAALALVGPAFAEATVKRTNYEGWKGCWELSNPLVRVVIVPQIGGRIMEYSISGKNAIWRNKVELGVYKPSDVGKKWHNYGGHKAWNAPQHRWRAPDYDNFYDYAPAQVEPAELVPDIGEKMTGVRVTCAPIPHLGLQFVREVYLSHRTSRVRLVETMRNISDRDIEWGIWNVTQADPHCWMAFPLHPTKESPNGWRRLLGPEYPDPHSVTPVGRVGVMRYTGAIDKVGTGSPDGWMVYLRDQLAYVKQWSVRTVDVVYPDDGCNMEAFTADRAMGAYVELEVLGPIVKLRPGESTQLIEDWFLTRVNQSASDPSDVIERLKLLQKRGLLPRWVKLDTP